jgi:hypothetical protein
MITDLDSDMLAVAHDELIDAVVDDFLQQDIDTVIHVRAVPETTDIHTGSQSNMLEGTERFDLAFIIGC